MPKSKTNVEAIHDFCLQLRGVQRDLLARDLYMEASCALAAVHRLIALAKCHEEGTRPFEPVSIPDLALPERLRRHVLEDTVHHHGPMLLQAASQIEQLDRSIWKLNPPRVTYGHLTTPQRAALLHNIWSANPKVIAQSLHDKGYLDRAGKRTRAGISFIWRMKERELNLAHQKHIEAGIPIIRMDSELIHLLRTYSHLRLRAWEDTSMVVADPNADAQPEAVLHPYYVWQIQVDKSAGLFLQKDTPINWLQVIPAPMMEAAA